MSRSYSLVLISASCLCLSSAIAQANRSNDTISAGMPYSKHANWTAIVFILVILLICSFLLVKAIERRTEKKL